MAEREIDVTMRSSYKGDLTEQLRKDERRIKAFQRMLDKSPLKVSVQLDLSGARSQAEALKKVILGEIGKIPAGILGADGRPTSVGGSAGTMSARAGVLSDVERRIESVNKNGETMVKTFRDITEQMGNGLTQVSKFKDGGSDPFETITKNTSNVKQFTDRLQGMNDQLRTAYNLAKGSGDKEGQFNALSKQAETVSKVIKDIRDAGLENSPVHAKAEKQFSGLQDRLNVLSGASNAKDVNALRAAAKRRYDNALRQEEERVDIAQKGNKQQIDRAAAIPDLVKREAELNKLYQERRKIFTDSQQTFNRLDKWRLGKGDEGGADKAHRRAQNMAGNAAQSDVEWNRASIAIDKAAAAEQLAIAKKAAADQKALADKAAAEKLAVEKKAHADGLANLRLDIEKRRAALEAGYNREIQDIKAASEKRIAEINRAEKRERQAAKGNTRRISEISAAAHQARQYEYGQRAGLYQDVSRRASASGMDGSADRARVKGQGAEVAAARDMDRFAAATARSGHALDFHSGGLLRNAATFVRWQVPMHAVMAVTGAFTAGVEGAIRVNRQFATLQTVFHGTAEEARMLKKETLDLAAAQGRSSDEAMDSSIRWSRLGLTRVQVLEATRVSLMAANVAEITAAESAEKLSGIYATYRLNIGDLAGVLNRLNSISNNYNVTVDDLFQGISRVSGVAKSSGLALRDLEGIIGSVVGAGGGSGAEVGNALKTVLVRLGDPKVGAGLKKAFDIDLTGPNGDLKDMSQIIRELADLYPTLNKAEQQRLMMLAAGSRQASRFSKVMSEYRQAQILAAEAGFDATASLRENEKILASLQSRIDSLKASWTQFAVALGDAGAMERTGELMRYLQQIVQGYSGRIDEAAEKTRNFLVSNAMYAEAIEKLGGGEDKYFGTRTNFNVEEVRKTLQLMEEAKKSQSGPTKDFIGKGLEGFRGKQISVANGMSGMFLTPQELDKAIAHYKKLLGEGGDDGFKNEIQGITGEVNTLREKIGAMDKSSKVFESLGKSFASGGEDRQTLLRDFQSAAHLLVELDNGTNLYADSVTRFNQILASGDTAKMSEFLASLAKLFTDQGRPLGDKLAGKLGTALPALDAKLIKLKAERDALMTTPSANTPDGRREKQESLDENLAKTKEVKGQIEQISQAVEKANETAFGGLASARINNYLDDVMAAAKAFGDAFKDFAPDAANDPIGRIMQRHRQSLEMGREALLEVQRQTAATSSENRNGAQSKIDALKGGLVDGMPGEARKTIEGQIAAQQRIIDQQNEADTIVKSKLQTEEENLESLRRELEIQEAIARVQRIQNDASERASSSARAWRFGETESDKDANQARSALERGRRGLNQAQGIWFNEPITGPNPSARANLAGGILQDEATARAALKSMEDRQYDIAAARKQVEIDTLKAIREQTEEASKRLQLASREDQLRAAALSRTIRDKGGIRSNEFYGLSQESRQAVVNYNPNEAPGLLNEAKSTRAKAIRDLNEENGRLTVAIADVRRGLESLAQGITDASGTGKPLDVKPGLGDGSVQKAAQSRDKNPVVNVDLGGVAITVKLHEEVDRLMRTYVDGVLKSGLAEMERRFSRPPPPTSQGITE